MNESVKTPWHLWVIGVVALLWNSAGVASYMATKLHMLDQMDITPEQLEYFYSFPAWASAVWALGVWGAFIGSVFLLLRRRWAVHAYGISLIGLLGTTIFERFVAVIPDSLATPGQNLFAVAIWVITIGLFLYARRMTAAGVLR